MNSENEHDVVILPDGTIRFLYYDNLKPLLDGTTVTVKRASHVDPQMTENGIKWFADLAPSQGPVLGPFETRDDAIAAEVKWMGENRLHRPTEEV